MYTAVSGLDLREWEPSPEHQHQPNSEIVNALEDDLTAADSDTDSLAEASKNGTRERDDHATQKRRRRLVLINRCFRPGAEGFVCTEESESDTEGFPSEDESCEEDQSEGEEIACAREEAEVAPDIPSCHSADF